MKGTLIVSLDFEMFWGMQDVTTLEEYKDHILGARNVAIPRLLKTFKKNGVHATWATVGFMFADSFNELKKYFPSEDLMPKYKIPERSAYRCFKDIGTNEEEAPCFYAPKLIKKISECEGQEIGCHTFSHYYCKEEGQTIEQFKADIKAARKIAEDKGYNLTSLVLPRNQCTDEYAKELKDLGITAFRPEERDWIHDNITFNPLLRILRLSDVYLPLTGKGGYIPKKENGVYALTGSRMYKPFLKPLCSLEWLKVIRIKGQMKNAAKKGLVFHFWWHPHNIGVKTDFHFKQLDSIFAYYKKLNEKYGMQSLNMSEAVEYFEKLKG